MNKQEAIEKINNMATLKIRDTTIHQQFDTVDKNKVLDIISQINEPKKVIVPQFVAEWVESQKESFSDASAIDMYDNLTLDNNGGYYHEVWLWVIDHHYDFIKAWHDGYEIEKEKLYTVELPNNGGCYHIVLVRNAIGKIKLINTENVIWKESDYAQLTEAEIKENFDWAWQFAEEVEE